VLPSDTVLLSVNNGGKSRVEWRQRTAVLAEMAEAPRRLRGLSSLAPDPR